MGGMPKETDQLDRVAVYQCRGCGQGTAVIEEQYMGESPTRQAKVGGPISFRGVHWWPPPGSGELDQVIPKGLRDSFSEGTRCLGTRSPRAGAVMFRRTIEGIVRDKGSTKAVDQLGRSDLPGALKIMAKEHTLDRNLAEWADDVRGLGNVGGHFDPLEDVSIEQADELAQLVRQILRYVYEEPARSQRLRDSRTKAE